MRTTPFWAEGATEEWDLPGHIGDFNRRSWSQTSSCPPAVKDPSPLPAARALTVTPPWARELVSPGPTHERPHRAVAGWCFGPNHHAVGSRAIPRRGSQGCRFIAGPWPPACCGRMASIVQTSEGGDVTPVHALHSDKAQGLPGTHRTWAGARLSTSLQCSQESVWELVGAPQGMLEQRMSGLQACVGRPPRCGLRVFVW